MRPVTRDVEGLDAQRQIDRVDVLERSRQRARMRDKEYCRNH
jgi:hypothetical protein